MRFAVLSFRIVVGRVRVGVRESNTSEAIHRLMLLMMIEGYLRFRLFIFPIRY